MKYRLAPIDTWPDLRVTFHLPPWTWRLRPFLYVDDIHPWSHATVQWLCIDISWWAENTPAAWFLERRT